MRFTARMAGWTLISVICVAVPICSAQHGAMPDNQAWRDPSPHTVQFITVDKDVRLEVLDWGGAGQPIVLLSGLGDTAHVFDDFAPRLTSQYNVYGITPTRIWSIQRPSSKWWWCPAYLDAYVLLMRGGGMNGGRNGEYGGNGYQGNTNMSGITKTTIKLKLAYK